nr:MAG TPA: hypothetical protein [Caudoviricetes sp.]
MKFEISINPQKKLLKKILILLRIRQLNLRQRYLKQFMNRNLLMMI